MKVLITTTRQVLVTASSTAEAEELYLDKGDDVVDELVTDVLVGAQAVNSPEHRVSTRRGEIDEIPHWVARCVCGWSGEEQLTPAAAQHDGAFHAAEVRA